MPPVHEGISGYVAGDKLNIRRIVPTIQTGRTLAKAWLTIKNAATDADPGLIQKVITSAAVPGTGQIVAIGDGTGGQPTGTGEVLFELTMTDTGTTLGPGKSFVFDIQLKFDNAEIATLSYGDLVFVRGVTDAAA